MPPPLPFSNHTERVAKREDIHGVRTQLEEAGASLGSAVAYHEDVVADDRQAGHRETGESRALPGSLVPE